MTLKLEGDPILKIYLLTENKAVSVMNELELKNVSWSKVKIKCQAPSHFLYSHNTYSNQVAAISD